MRKEASRLLWMLLIVQMGALSVVLGRARTSGGPSPVRTLAMGDSVPRLTGVRPGGVADTVNLRQGNVTLILAFASTCAYCEQVAPSWHEWLARSHPGVTAVALASEDVATAEAYRARHRWNARVLAAPNAGPMSAERALTVRTPWLYAFNAQGQLVLMRHGAHINEVDSLLSATPR